VSVQKYIGRAISHFGACQSCGATGPVKLTAEEAVAAWNEPIRKGALIVPESSS
jgi:hypothetical protein